MRKKLLYWIVGPIIWIICGVYNYGAMWAHENDDFPLSAPASQTENRVAAAIVGAAGPFATPTVIIYSSKFWNGHPNHWRLG